MALQKLMAVAAALLTVAVAAGLGYFALARDKEPGKPKEDTRPGTARAEEKPDYARLLVGKWEVSKVPSDDEGTVPVGAIIEFTKDGKMKATFKRDGEDVSMEATYKVEGEAFVMTIKRGEEERPQKITITKITDKEMATKSENGRVLELTRRK